MAAALAFVAMAAGLLFTKTEKIQLRGPEIVTADSKTLQEPAALPATEPVVAKTSAAKIVSRGEKASDHFVKQGAEKKLIAMQPSATKNHLGSIGTTNKKELEVSVLEIDALPQADKEALIAQVNPVEPVKEVATIAEQPMHKESVRERNAITNVGDLVNFVVDKVDKRDQKFLQFKTDDDDNSSLVAINIGIIKFNSRNKSKR